MADKLASFHADRLPVNVRIDRNNGKSAKIEPILAGSGRGTLYNVERHLHAVAVARQFPGEPP
jgi:hypothetical protein